MPDFDSTIFLQPFYQWDTFTPQPVIDYGLTLDSLFPARELPPLVVRPSLLQPLSFPVSHPGLLPRADVSQPAWLFVLLISLVVLLCIYYSTRKVKLRQLLPALVDSRAQDRLVRSSNLTPLRLATSGLLLVAMIAVAVRHYLFPTSSFLGWAAVALALAVAYFLRWVIMRFVSRVFYNLDAMSAYITNAYLYHLTLATLLAPLLFLMVYMPVGYNTLFYAFICIISAAFLARILSGMRIFFTQSSTRSFNLFYYLCIVEIAPLLVLLKWVFAQ